MIWNKGKKLAKYVDKVCETCGNIFSVRASELRRRYKARFCSTKCHGISIKGVSTNQGRMNPNWKHGKANEPYPRGFTKWLKELIRERDGYKCQICGIPQMECMSKLFVHHIDYDKHNLSLKNLISLCNSCHTKTNFRRAKWKSLLAKNVVKY